MPDFAIRPATLDDCAAMARVRVLSITELCSADHQDDPAAIAAWIGDEGASKFVKLLGKPEVTLLVAQRDGAVVALGGTWRDVVTLNYIDPGHRFVGIGKAIMAALEAGMEASGIRHARLASTRTALRFYQHLGWEQTGPGTASDGIPMLKDLGAS